MKQHKWHKEIKAWADGAEIEANTTWSDGSETGWHSIGTPQWKSDVEYRIKPEPIPDVIKYLNMIVNNYGTTVYITDTIDDNPHWEIRIKLTLHCDTYEPKSVELIEKGEIK